LVNPARGEVRLAILLGVLSGIATLCVFPYVLAIMPQIARTLQEKGVPIAVLVAAQSIQSAVLCAVTGWIGLRLGRGLGLDAPLLRAIACRVPLPSRLGLGLSAVLGLAAGAAVLGMSSEAPQSPSGESNDSRRASRPRLRNSSTSSAPATNPEACAVNATPPPSAWSALTFAPITCMANQ